MKDPFYSSKRCLERAKYHFRDFQARVQSFARDKDWKHVRERDEKGRAKNIKIKFSLKFFDEAPCIVFDAVNNMRAALDQAGYAAARASGNTRLKKTAFPFGKELSDLDNAIDGRKVCKDIPPEIVAIFRRFKPYKTGNANLWHLNLLCNEKKHAILIPANLDELAVQFHAGPLTIGLRHKWVPEDYEIELLGSANMNLENTGELTFTVTFDHVEPYLSRSEPLALLNAMLHDVQSVLMVTETECRRLWPKAFE